MKIDTQGDARDVLRPECTVHVVLPAYNEEGSLPPLLSRLERLSAELPSRLVVWVVDDGSHDQTPEIARHGAGDLDVRLLQHPANKGLGQALNTGIHAVLDAAGENDIAVVMDSDDTHDVNLIKIMRQRVDAGAHIVIASRFVAGGDDSTAPAFRRLLSRGAFWVFRILFPLVGVKDFTSGYRAYHVSLLRPAAAHWGERLVEERGFACMVELLLKLRHWHPTIEEVPLVLRYDRKAGQSKLKLGRTILQYINLAIRDRVAPPPSRMTHSKPIVPVYSHKVAS